MADDDLELEDYPPVAGNTSAPPPVDNVSLYPPLSMAPKYEAPTSAPAIDSGGGQPPVMPLGAPSQPNLNKDVLAGGVAPPSSLDAAYQPVKPSTKSRIMNRIAAGMIGYSHPALGVQVRNEFENAPKIEANQHLAHDTAEYNNAATQGLAQSKEASEAPLREAETRKANADADALKDPLGKLPPEAKAYFAIPGNEHKNILDYEKDKAAAGAAGRPVEGEIPLGPKVDDFNNLLQSQFQVLNPGKPLPPEMALPANATQKDYDRRESVLKTMESAAATQAQREIGNSYRAQAAELSKQNQQDREEKQGMKWVSWSDKDGHVIAGSLAQAREAGAKNPAEVPTEEVRNITDARQAVNLINKQGDPKSPETMGVLQLAHDLDKEGKMGVFASRYNDFVTKGIGAMPNDDPRVVTLLDKGQLLMTLAMKAHFGASGGRSPQMLEHFIAMANAGKMDGPTFIGGAKAVGNYMEDRAMMPAGAGGQHGGGKNAPDVGAVEGGYKFKGGNPADKNNWEKTTP